MQEAGINQKLVVKENMSIGNSENEWPVEKNYIYLYM